MLNLNEIPIDCDAKASTHCEINGEEVSLNGVTEETFAFESDFETFMQGVDFIAERAGKTYVRSTPKWRKWDNGKRQELVVRFVVGEQDKWGDDE